MANANVSALFLSVHPHSSFPIQFSQVLASADVAIAMLQAGVPTAVLETVGHQVGEAVAAVLRQYLGDALQNKVNKPVSHPLFSPLGFLATAFQMWLMFSCFSCKIPRFCPAPGCPRSCVPAGSSRCSSCRRGRHAQLARCAQWAGGGALTHTGRLDDTAAAVARSHSGYIARRSLDGRARPPRHYPCCPY